MPKTVTQANPADEGARKPQVVIIGAGFGGLYAAKALANKPVEVLVIDRNNYHTFVPLLYQVATAGLEPEEVASPVRGILRDAHNIKFQLGEVTSVDTERKLIHMVYDGHALDHPYDYLIASPGSTTTYFGMKDVEEHSFGLKALDEAVEVRNHILSMFEQAMIEPDPKLREALMTVVVVGGGPTGLEMSGAISELFRHVFTKDYPHLDLSKARVVLVEATDRLLAAFPESLQKSAKRQVEYLGVEVLLNKSVASATDSEVVFKDGHVISTKTVLWAAGVESATLNGINVERGKAKRYPVQPTLQLATDPCVYIIGDAALLNAPDGKPYPQLAPVAMQMGTLASQNILAASEGKPLTNFGYQDRGIMATIGRDRAVAWVFNKIKLSGFLAWLAWLGLHLIYLIGFRNRLNVLINWAWNWWTWDRGVRIILSRNVHPNN